MQISQSTLVSLNRLLLDLKSRLTNLQTRMGSRAIAETHYDLDHRLYKLVLGPYNQYTCCFFNKAETLEDAEIEKLEMICNKLDLKEGEKVLDIGCGWGGFARYAADHLFDEIDEIVIQGQRRGDRHARHKHHDRQADHGDAHEIDEDEGAAEGRHEQLPLPSAGRGARGDPALEAIQAGQGQEQAVGQEGREHRDLVGTRVAAGRRGRGGRCHRAIGLRGGGNRISGRRKAQRGRQGREESGESGGTRGRR